MTATGSSRDPNGGHVPDPHRSGRTRIIAIDDHTAAVLRQHQADQAAEQVLAGDYWRGTSNCYVFTNGWGEPIYPDTVTTLMTKLIRAHNDPENGSRPTDQRVRAATR